MKKGQDMNLMLRLVTAFAGFFFLFIQMFRGFENGFVIGGVFLVLSAILWTKRSKKGKR